jgi:hypothetical protein
MPFMIRKMMVQYSDMDMTFIYLIVVTKTLRVMLKFQLHTATVINLKKLIKKVGLLSVGLRMVITLK